MGDDDTFARGVTLAQQVVLWSLFNGPGTMTAGELRKHIVQIFGPEVDAELHRRYVRATDSASELRT